MAPDGDRTRRQVLSAHAPRTDASRSRVGKLAAALGSRGTDTRHGGRRLAMNWWSRWFRREEREASLDKEVTFHIEEPSFPPDALRHKRGRGAAAGSRRVRRRRAGKG